MAGAAFVISQLVFSAIHVRGQYEWVFVEVSDPDGYTGLAELAGPGASGHVAAVTADLANELRASPVGDEREVPDRLGLSTALLERDRVLATAVSALCTAILDAQAQREGVSLVDFLGGPAADGAPHGRRAVRLYGNVNRSMLPDDHGPVDRSPGAFGAAARLAAEDGFKAVKCAPFDECRAPFSGDGVPAEARAGLDRIAAVKDGIGPGTELFVDCHGRFDLGSALSLEAELWKLGVAWYEEAVDSINEASAMAAICERARMRVAGGETGYGERLFRRLIERKAMDVVMPDVKYCGGAGEAVRLGRSLEAERPWSVSMHAPAGPAAQLASGHATMAFGGTAPLEYAWGEAPWRATVLDPPERVEDGALLLPDGPGLGAALNPACVEERGRRWTV